MLKHFLVLLISFVVINVQAQTKTTYFSLEEALKNPNSVYRLDLSHQELTQIPASISKLKRLKRLDLSYNQLSDLSPILDSLKDLRHLHLNNNELTALPAKLFQFTKLKRLYLSNNQLSELSKDIKNLRKLKCLELTNNQIATLPEELWELEDINILRFDDPIFLEFDSPFLPNEHPILNWITMERPDSIGGKALSFYLNHPNIDPYSKRYVQGKYALDENRAACVFIDSIFTKNPETAIFYAYLYAKTITPGIEEFPLFQLLYSKRRAFLLEQPCLFMTYYKDYLEDVYYMDEGILDEKKQQQQIINQLKGNCSFVYENEVDLYFNYLNFFLPQADRKGQIGVRVNDTLEEIEYICLYDNKEKELGDTYLSTYYRNIEWFEKILPGEYTLVFYTKEGYAKRKEKGTTRLVDSANVILRKEVVLKSIHESLVVEIGTVPPIIPIDTLLPPPPPPPPPSPPVQVSAVSEEYEVVEVIDEETGEVIEVYIDEEIPIDSNYMKELQARKDTCNQLFYTTKAETLAFFLEAVYNPAAKKSTISKETMHFLTAIKQYLVGETTKEEDELNPFYFPIMPSYFLQEEGASIILDTKNNWSLTPFELPSRHKELIRQKVKLYYSNSAIVQECTVNKCNKYDNDCEIWMNYPLCQVEDTLLPAFCSQEIIQLKYEEDTLVDQLLQEQNDCDNIWKSCATDENQSTFASLQEVPNLYFTRSKYYNFPARGIYLKINDQKLVEIWYHDMESELCGCGH